MLAEWESDEDLADTPAVVVEVARRVDSSFDGRASSTETLLLATGIDTASWRRGVLEVLVHQLSSFAASAVLWVRVRGVELDPSDPSVELIGPEVASVRVESSTLAGELLTAGFETAAARLRVSLEWVQGAVEAASPQTVALTIRLIGRMA